MADGPFRPQGISKELSFSCALLQLLHKYIHLGMVDASCSQILVPVCVAIHWTAEARDVGEEQYSTGSGYGSKGGKEEAIMTACPMP